MKYLLTSVAALALLAGCGNNGSDDIPAEAAAAGAEFADTKVPSFKLRKGDAGTAAAAATALNLEGETTGRMTFADVDMSGAKATFQNVRLLPHDSEGEPLTAESVVFEGLGMIDGAANFSQMTMKNVGITPDPDDADAPEGFGKVESITLSNPSPELAAWVGSLMGDGEVGELPTGDAMSFDQFAMDTLTFEIDDETEAQGSFLIDKIAITGVKDQKVAQVMLSNLVLDMIDPSDDTDIDARVKSIELRGADLSSLQDVSEQPGGDAMEAFMSGLMSSNPVDPGFDSMTVDDMSMKVSGANIEIPSIISRVARDEQGRATLVQTPAFSLNISADEGELGEQLAAGLAQMGYESIELSAQSETSYNPDSDIMTYTPGKNFWKLNDGFKFDISGKFEGLGGFYQAMETDGAAMAGGGFEQALEAMVLHGLELKFDDDGFVDRAFNAYASQSGDDPQQVRNQTVGLLSMAPMMAAGAGVDSELASEFSNALSSFLSDPKTLTLKIAPAQPLRVSELAATADTTQINKDMLGFSASNE